MSKRRTRVMYVDDSADARTLLAFVLRSEADLEDVGSLGSADGLEEAIRAKDPDVLLIDLTMHGRDPIQAIRDVHLEFPALRIVVLSGSRDPALLGRARAAGASELALKAMGFTETLAAIRGNSQ